ncbi:hypothetical protein PGB90_005235 [Kerria lacca]
MYFMNVRCKNEKNETDWTSSSVFNNISSLVWFSGKEAAHVKLGSPRSFDNNRLDDHSYEFNELINKDDYKAIPFSISNQYPTSSSSISITNVKPPLQQFYGIPSTYSSASISTYPQNGYYYPGIQYLPPSSPPQNFEDFGQYQSPQSFSNSEINPKNVLFVQPSKCSNSIQVIRMRDVEVTNTYKYGTNTQKGICVLMLYAANETNELAVSLQPAQDTTNIIPMGNWLETNVKIYAIQMGAIVPLNTKLVFEMS